MTDKEGLLQGETSRVTGGQSGSSLGGRAREAEGSASDTCFHCGLPLPSSELFEAEIDGQRRRFCCFGCQSVCKMIFESGLEGFYQRAPEGAQLAPPPELPKNLSFYDLDEIQSEYVTHLGEQREIDLLVEGIHCAACVWLIERGMAQLPGVTSANVNLSGRRLHLRWDNSQVKLSRIMAKLGEIGYAAVPFDPDAAEGRLKKQNRAFLFRIAFAGFTMMNMLWISIALYTGADEGEFRTLFYWVGMALATPTLLYSGFPFLKGAWTGIKRAHMTMDVPIAIGASATYLYSSYSTIFNPLQGHVYFDTVVNLIFVLLVGRFLESTSKRHAVAATQRLMDLQPRVATRLKEDKEQTVPVRALKPGDLILVKAGEQIPADGSITDGRSTVNEAMLTGESRPVEKGVGDSVSAGTMNLGSAIQVEVSGVLKDTTLGRIIHLVEEAQASKAPIQRIADRIVPWFVTITLLLAVTTLGIWWESGFEKALMAAVSVLIITCPCAFGMATPMAIAVASGLGARNGILIKNGEVLETLSGISHFVFDKTGTLTEGRMKVQELHLAGGVDEREVVRLAAAAESQSEHIIARAIVQRAEAMEIGIGVSGVSGFENRSGSGVSAEVEGHKILLGSRAWMAQNRVKGLDGFAAVARRLEEQAVTCVYMAVDGGMVALFGVADQLRPSAAPLLDSLRSKGIHLTLLSGDSESVARAVATRLGGMEVIAEVLPEQKDSVIQRLQERGEKVAMVGDGINDAPALIRADVGISLGSGTDASMESSDIVLMSDELDKVEQAVALSRRTLRTIRQNIGISLIYNSIMVPLAMMAYVTPLVAAIAMPISSLAVIGNSARIRTLFTERGTDG